MHGLAAQLGGALDITSKLGLGTCIELWLPASAEAAVVTCPHGRPQERSSPTHTDCPGETGEHHRLMKQLITPACGHEQAHQLAGFASQQARKAGWLQTTPCKTCFVAAKRSEEAAAAVEAGAVIAHLDLPQLHGSDRQVACPITIRTQRLAAIVTQAATGDADGKKACLATADASWWIDHRDLAGADLLVKARLYTGTAGPAVNRGPGTDMAQAA